MKTFYPLSQARELPFFQKFLTFFLLLSLFFFAQLSAQPITHTPLQPLPVSTTTADKPQSKAWTYNGEWYCVMANPSGTHIWQLNGTTWTSVFTLANNSNMYADVKVAGTLVHLLLFDDLLDDVYIQTLEYNAGTQTYQPWSVNPNATLIDVGVGGGRRTETAVIEKDSQGKMWFCYERDGAVFVRWSNAPYTSWSGNIQIVSGLIQRDIAGLIAFSDNEGSKIGVAWSNHNTQRFGFRYHLDTNPETTWSSDEIPGNSQAFNVGLGMADDHVNLATASDGHLYMAAKTSYDLNGFVTLILLDRKPNQTWDYYEVEFNDSGTKPIVVVNEASNEIFFAYSYPDNNTGDLVYKTASRDTLSNLASANRTILLNRDGSSIDMASSIKDTWSEELVVMGYHLASGTMRSTFVEMSLPIGDTTPPSVVLNLTSPGHTTESVDLQWDASTDNTAVTGYKVYVDGILQDSTAGTTFTVTGLAAATAYDFQVSARDAAGNHAALSAVLTVSTDKLAQSITFAPLADKQTADVPFTVSASASSGLPVSFSLVSGPATLNGSTVTLTGIAGTVTLRASQAGNATYFPAANVDQSFEVTEPVSSVLVSSQINAASDDMEERLLTGKMDAGSLDLELGYEGIYAQLVGLRFTGLNIPQGSVILNAYVQFTTDQVKTGATSLNIRGQDSDNAVTFPTVKFSASTRPKTTAAVPWNPVAWNIVGEKGPNQQTPDISAVVQEIVDRPGWTTSSALVIFLDGTGVRTATAYEASPANSPKIFVEYQ
ncbi:MAG: hypothetical protein SF052_12555, partial [Bacteroidia bacterium]|nr:hypothetical protein [Bacteroidia bacterium]